MKVLGSGGRPERGCVVTIGAFDGVHLGHQALIGLVRDRADQLGCASAVVTFDRHPASVVRPESAPKLLTDLDRKLELLASTGVDYTLVLPFNEVRAAEPAEDFVNNVLIGRLNARSVIVGHDFHFGYKRRGNLEMLAGMGASLDFAVEEVGAVADGGTTISSTEIRRLVAAGDVAGAARLLGRPHELRGLVVMGDGRGRELGYPTANLQIQTDILVPGDAVYSGWYVFPDSSLLPAAISVGTRPTFYEQGTSLIEAYVLDFDGDLYGQHGSIRFVDRLRDQRRFDSTAQLVAQIESDVAHTRLATA